MFGGDAPRSYLLLFLQPAEAREYGGFVGQYAVLHVDNGALSVGRAGSSGDFGNVDAAIADPDAVDLWPQWTGDPSETIDGVITLDPYAVAALLELSGPVFMPAWGESLTADNAVNYLLRDQYFIFDADDPARNAERKAALNELIAGTISQLLDGVIPGPDELGRVLGPVARSNRLAISTINDDENVFLDRIFLSADMPNVGEEADLLAVFGDQTRASKIDA